MSGLKHASFASGEPHRWVPVEDSHHTGRQVLEGVEFYDDGLALRWFLDGAAPQPDRDATVDDLLAEMDQLDPMLYRVTDDLGTEYDHRFDPEPRGQALTRPGIGEEFRWRQFLTPAVPATATSLVITGHGRAITVLL